MQFFTRIPGPPLDASIDLIWLCEQPSSVVSLERVLPTGAPQLIVNLAEDRTRRYIERDGGFACEQASGTVVTGALSQYDIIDTAEQSWVAGVAFKPAGLVSFVPMPWREMSGDVDAESLWGRAAASRLRDRIYSSDTRDGKLKALEAVLLEQWNGRVMHRAVRFAVDAFQSRPHIASVAEVTDAVGLSAKRFIERFKAEVGITPKRYCRVQRFQTAVVRSRRRKVVDWTDVALGAGYYDQAHFIHEFKAFAGLTPTEYAAAQTPFANHVKFLQAGAAQI